MGERSGNRILVRKFWERDKWEGIGLEGRIVLK
jgi:hypothetical protein